MPRIIVGTITGRDFNARTQDSIEALQVPQGYEVRQIRVTSAILWLARGQVVDRFLADPENHYLFFLDSDMVAPPHTLVSMLGRDADVVACLCCKREPPFWPVFYTGWNDMSGATVANNFFPLQGAHPIWGSGGACFMTKRHVWDRIREKFDGHYFYHDRIGNKDVIGEDVTFYRKANALGFRTILDADVHVGHIMDYPVYPTDAMRWFPYAANERANAYKAAVEREELKTEIEKLRIREKAFEVVKA